MAEAPTASSLANETPPPPVAPSGLTLLSWHASGITKILQEETARLENERKKLEQDRATFNAVKEKVAMIHFPNKLKLNVGGQIFATSLDTLRREKDSVLATMFSGSGFKLEPDEDGAYFIDRDPTQFRHILNYLRSGKVIIPNEERELEELMEDLDFYQISGYIRAIKDETEVNCKWEHIGDTNGIFYWLGTNGKTNPTWTNPINSGIVKLTTSGGTWYGGNQNTVIERGSGALNGGICKVATPVAAPAFGAAPAAAPGLFGAPVAVAPAFSFTPSSPFTASPVESKSLFQLELPVAVLLSSYSVHRGNCKNPIDWLLEGSEDGRNWSKLHVHENDQALQNATEGHWLIGASEAYRFFRWSSADNSQCLHLSCIELYGTFAKPQQHLAVNVTAHPTRRMLLRKK